MIDVDYILLTKVIAEISKSDNITKKSEGTTLIKLTMLAVAVVFFCSEGAFKSRSPG